MTLSHDWQTLDDLEHQAKNEDIEIFARQIFKDDPSAAVADLKRQAIIRIKRIMIKCLNIRMMTGRQDNCWNLLCQGSQESPLRDLQEQDVWKKGTFKCMDCINV